MNVCCVIVYGSQGYWVSSCKGYWVSSCKIHQDLSWTFASVRGRGELNPSTLNPKPWGFVYYCRT